MFDPQFLHAIPVVNDPALVVEPFIDGLIQPTSFVFIDNDSILVLEKKGTVRLISNGTLNDPPVFDAPVNTTEEAGMLGIAALQKSSDSGAKNQVFLFYTDSTVKEFKNNKTYPTNRVYKFDWDGKTLSNRSLILDLPASPVPSHYGGKLMIGPDDYLYTITGDRLRDGKVQNFPDGPDPDNTSAILRVNPENGSAPPDNPLFFSKPGSLTNELSRYYAYGIRNGFGLAFDPVTGILWETENGANEYDEINIVYPGFNSGWQTIMGPSSLSRHKITDLVNFTGSRYADPVLSWKNSVGITDLEFLSSSLLGENYRNDLFVGDFNNGNLYRFEFNANRSGLSLQDPVASDLVVDEDDLHSIIFATGFGGITDLATGPDGFLYVLSYGDGVIYRIKPAPL